MPPPEHPRLPPDEASPTRMARSDGWAPAYHDNKKYNANCKELTARFPAAAAPGVGNLRCFHRESEHWFRYHDQTAIQLHPACDCAIGPHELRSLAGS